MANLAKTFIQTSYTTQYFYVHLTVVKHLIVYVFLKKEGKICQLDCSKIEPKTYKLIFDLKHQCHKISHLSDSARL